MDLLLASTLKSHTSRFQGVVWGGSRGDDNEVVQSLVEKFASGNRNESSFREMLIRWPPGGKSNDFSNRAKPSGLPGKRRREASAELSTLCRMKFHDFPSISFQLFSQNCFCFPFMENQLYAAAQWMSFSHQFFPRKASSKVGCFPFTPRRFDYLLNKFSSRFYENGMRLSDVDEA